MIICFTQFYQFKYELLILILDNSANRLIPKFILFKEVGHSNDSFYTLFFIKLVYKIFRA